MNKMGIMELQLQEDDGSQVSGQLLAQKSHHNQANTTLANPTSNFMNQYSHQKIQLAAQVPIKDTQLSDSPINIHVARPNVQMEREFPKKDKHSDNAYQKNRSPRNRDDQIININQLANQGIDYRLQIYKQNAEPHICLERSPPSLMEDDCNIGALSFINHEQV
ncbi:hypothetical protein FGO68_gene14085 [Halteria grandinella]|uniref:Uncharacterized protein n=1 Tax=Halteria grandinella TaxID=5974 RepID=A0A8J8P400_HALGN|nr:hypothetical protein FGO68_gene14085 [Halteria grandinella]